MWWERERVVSMKGLSALHHRHVARSTACRWCRAGLLDGEGKRVKLESFVSGGERLTTQEAYQRFIQALNGRE